MPDFLVATIRALGFLTRIPLRSVWFSDKKSVADDAAYFPLASLAVGIAGSLIFVFCILLGFSPLTSSLIYIAALCTITGALHEDGLSDVADGFFAPRPREDRLYIMKDSHIGVFGMLALLFSIGLRVSLSADIYSAGGFWAIITSILVAQAASRGAMVWMWATLPLARTGGVADKAGKPTVQARAFASLSSLIVLALLIFLPHGFLSFSLATALLVLGVYAFIALSSAKIGGYTGDTLGAMQQIGEILVLIGVAISL